MKKFILYTHKYWRDFAWESINASKYITWDVRRCDHGDPHPHPPGHSKVFYTDSELCHAKNHADVTRIAFMLESRYISPQNYEYLEQHIDNFDRVLTYDASVIKRFPKKCTFFPHGNCVIKREDFALHKKTKLVSFISSAKQMDVSGHIFRHLFYHLYRKRQHNWCRSLIGDTEVDLYGELAKNHIHYKLQSLQDYMFQVVMENGILDTYFTEKIIDCFVTGTIPIYYGTKKISDFFDADGIIQFTTLEELFEILGGLTAEEYAKRSKAITRNYETAQKYLLAEDWIYENTDVFS